MKLKPALRLGRKKARQSGHSAGHSLFSFIIPLFRFHNFSSIFFLSPRCDSLATRRRERKRGVDMCTMLYAYLNCRENMQTFDLHRHHHAFLRLNMIISLPSPRFSMEYLVWISLSTSSSNGHPHRYPVSRNSNGI